MECDQTVELNYALFEPLEGETLMVSDEQGNTAEVKVEQVKLGNNDAAQFESFAIYLSSSEEVHIPQGTYRFSHPRIGEQALFVSPNSAVEYEIIISRMKKADN